MQRKWYRMLLEKDIDAVNGASDPKGEVADKQVPLARKRERRDCSTLLCNFENAVITLIVSTYVARFASELTFPVFDGAVSFDIRPLIIQS